MSGTVWAQDSYDLRFDWGLSGARELWSGHGALVVIDVLSFTTSVSIAVDRGTAVYPAPWRDDRAEDLASKVGAELAVGRSEVGPERPWSLSPADLAIAPAPPRLVLPSPNGSSIAAACDGVVVACSLRNVRAVARWLKDEVPAATGPIVVIAAGERWPDETLRPALEDLIGAGCLLSELIDDGERSASPEALAAVAAFSGAESAADAVRDCGSGRELIERGYAMDVELAVEINVSECVPLLRDGAFVRA